MKYGIELEFFTQIGDFIEPAYKHTTNLDGNPVIGELRTKVHPTIEDAVFEMKKLIYQETKVLAKKGVTLALIPSFTASNELLTEMRADSRYANRKQVETLKEHSIYSGKTGKLLPRGLFKASLQINLSSNNTFYYQFPKKIRFWTFKYIIEKNKEFIYSQVFDYVTPIRTLDQAFKEEIAAARRVKGVYAIKDGEFGQRIEYRSLPNDIDMNKLMELL